MSYNNVVGSKYNRDMSIAEIAKTVRGEIKEAIKTGLLPNGKYSVRCKTYTGGQSLYVRIYGVPHMNQEWVLYGDSQGRSGTDFRYNEEGRRVLSYLEQLLDSYNYDKGDPVTDYFDQNFCGFVTFDSDEEEIDAIRLAAKQAA